MQKIFLLSCLKSRKKINAKRVVHEAREKGNLRTEIDRKKCIEICTHANKDKFYFYKMNKKFEFFLKIVENVFMT